MNHKKSYLKRERWIRATSVYHYYYQQPGNSRGRQFITGCNDLGMLGEDYWDAEKFAFVEFDSNDPICDNCKYFMDRQEADLSKEVREVKQYYIELKKDKRLLPRACARAGCRETGVAYVPFTGEEKPHFCMAHNPKRVTI